MRRHLFTLTSLVCSLALAATVYKWVDENGIVHYSDQPHPNAQKVGVQPAQTYKAGDVPAAPGGPIAPPAAAQTKTCTRPRICCNCKSDVMLHLP